MQNSAVQKIHLSSFVSPSRLGGLLLSMQTGIVRVAAEKLPNKFCELFVAEKFANNFY